MELQRLPHPHQVNNDYSFIPHQLDLIHVMLTKVLFFLVFNRLTWTWMMDLHYLYYLFRCFWIGFSSNKMQLKGSLDMDLLSASCVTEFGSIPCMSCVWSNSLYTLDSEFIFMHVYGVEMNVCNHNEHFL